MLTISLKVGESFRIGDGIKVMIVKISEGDIHRGGRKVRIGIEAPPSMSVHRQEIYEKIQSEKNPPPTI